MLTALHIFLFYKMQNVLISNHQEILNLYLKFEYLNKNVRSSNLCTTPLIINFIQCTNQCIVNIILSNVLDLQVYRHYGHLESAQYSN